MLHVEEVENSLVPKKAKVLKVIKETPDTYTIYLEPLDEERFPEFKPGQFNMLYAFGVGESPISISGDPEERKIGVHTVRIVGAVTKAIAKSKPGEIIGIRGPFGTSWPLDEAKGRDVLIIAGGIGLAPLRPAIYQIIRNRKDYDRVWILYGARAPEHLLYKKEIRRWRSRLDLEVLVTVDYAPPEFKCMVGVVTTLFPYVRVNPENTVAMICGPEIMMKFTIKELEKMNIPHENIYISMERNMKCAVGFCGHCQYGWHFLCIDGPVFQYSKISKLFWVSEI